MTLVPITRTAPVADPRFGRAYAAPMPGMQQFPITPRIQGGPPSSLRRLAQSQSRSLGMGDVTNSATANRSRYAGNDEAQIYYGAWDTTRSNYVYPLAAQGLGQADAAAIYTDREQGDDALIYYGAWDTTRSNYHYPLAAQGLGQADGQTSIAQDILSAVPGGQAALNYVKQKYLDFVALGGQISSLRQQADQTQTAIATAGGDVSNVAQVASDASSLQDDYNAAMSKIESIADVLRQEGVLGQLITVAILVTIVAVAGAMAYVFSKYATVKAALAAVASQQLTAPQAAQILGAGGGGSTFGGLLGGISLTTLALLGAGVWLLSRR